MLVFGVILAFALIIIGFLFILMGNNKRKDNLLLFGALLFWIGSYSFGSLVIYYVAPVQHSKKVTLKTEIRQEIVNGEEVSIDTVYIFTRKK